MFKRKLYLSLFIVIPAMASPAVGQQSNPASTDNIVVTGQTYERKVVCRFQQQTGTRFQTRVCHTNKEWDDMREQQRRDAHEMFDRPQISTARGG